MTETIAARRWLIGNEIYRRMSFPPRHPLAIARVAPAIDLIRAMGWLEPEEYVDAEPASVEALARFHHADYIAAVIEAERAQDVTAETRRRYRLGTIEAPIYAEMFRRPATACGASIRAAELVQVGGIAFSPASGTHHGRPNRASGFCFFNDPVLGLMRLLDFGIERVLYVDIDAHRGDGVEDAFAGDPRVLTLSVHEAGRWPDHASGARPRPASATDFAINIAVEPGFNDDEMQYLVDQAMLPVAAAYRPQAIMLQAGADALADDPLSKLALSNRGHWLVAAALRDFVAARNPPRLIATGGGGYNPWSVARCWAGLWATLCATPIPDHLPDAAEAVLRKLTWNRAAGVDPPQHWFTTLADRPRHGPVRSEIRTAVVKAIATAAGFGLRAA